MSTTTQRWPSASDYSRAIQAPEAVFTDDRLRRLHPVLGTLGVPMGASGQNAVVYLLSDAAGSRYAVRCYTTPANDARARYDALGQFVASRGGIDRIATATWIDAAMSIDGSRWPIVLMPWVEGAPLTAAVEDLAAEDPSTLVALAERISHTVRNFQATGMSHGDLQHGNILVTHDGAMTLVDLDGVWVPDMAVGAPGEYGHPNYQHPHRTPAHWGPNVDTFSAALIDMSLRAVAADPGLVSFQAGENLVLVRRDLQEPDASEAVARLRSNPSDEVRARLERLLDAARAPIEHSLVPLDEFLDPASTVIRRPAAPAPPPPVPVSTLAAADDWWVDASTPPSILPPPGSPVAANVPPPPAPAPAAAVSGPASSAVAAAPATASGRRGIPLVWAGALGGMVAGLLTCWLFSLLWEVVDSRARVPLFVSMLSLLIGSFMFSLQDAWAGQWARALQRGLAGGAVSLCGGVLGIVIADPLFRAMIDESKYPVTGYFEAEVVPVAVVWAVVAACIGAGLGALISVRAALFGLSAGLVAGGAGGAVFAPSASLFRGPRVVIQTANPTAVLATMLVAALIGASAAVARRAGAAARLTVVEGPGRGQELLVTKQAVIGSAWSNRADHLRVAEPSVLPRHAVVRLDPDRSTITLHGPAVVDGAMLAPGDHVLRSGAVLVLAGACIRFTRRNDAEQN